MARSGREFEIQTGKIIGGIGKRDHGILRDNTKNTLELSQDDVTPHSIKSKHRKWVSKSPKW